MSIFWIRHAQSENNARPESERVADPLLTSVGEEQAQRLGEWIHHLQLTHVITSPFLRTLQTADEIRRATGLMPEVRAEWHEHGGCYSGYLEDHIQGEPGLTRAELLQQFPGYRPTESITETGWYTGTGRETYEAARSRAKRLVKELCAEFSDSKERVAFVIHADLKRFLIDAFHPAAVDVPYNTSVTTVEVKAGQIRMVDFNRLDHLPDHLHTF